MRALQSTIELKSVCVHNFGFVYMHVYECNVRSITTL